jgi:hypothetical protein
LTEFLPHSLRAKHALVPDFANKIGPTGVLWLNFTNQGSTDIKFYSNRRARLNTISVTMVDDIWCLTNRMFCNGFVPSAFLLQHFARTQLTDGSKSYAFCNFFCLYMLSFFNTNP